MHAHRRSMHELQTEILQCMDDELDAAHAVNDSFICLLGSR